MEYLAIPMWTVERLTILMGTIVIGAIFSTIIIVRKRRRAYAAEQKRRFEMLIHLHNILTPGHPLRGAIAKQKKEFLSAAETAKGEGLGLIYRAVVGGLDVLEEALKQCDNALSEYTKAPQGEKDAAWSRLEYSIRHMMGAREEAIFACSLVKILREDMDESAGKEP